MFSNPTRGYKQRRVVVEIKNLTVSFYTQLMLRDGKHICYWNENLEQAPLQSREWRVVQELLLLAHQATDKD